MFWAARLAQKFTFARNNLLRILSEGGECILDMPPFNLILSLTKKVGAQAAAASLRRTVLVKSVANSHPSTPSSTCSKARQSSGLLCVSVRSVTGFGGTLAIDLGSHPTVGVALCGTKVSDQLSSLSEELPVRMIVLGS